QLLTAIKRVYGSTFSRVAKGYFTGGPYRLEEEKMAVVLQRLVGAAHGPRFYPDFAGVARSHNYYPLAPMRSEDGIAAVALGLGQDSRSRSRPASFQLRAAEEDGTLARVGSTYSSENDAVYDGVSRPGVRLVTFAPVLKHNLFPLAELLDALLGAAARATGTPVEIEFAVSFARGAPPECGVLQLRPLGRIREGPDADISAIARERLVCESRNVLGHGAIADVRDVVVVDMNRFDRTRTHEIAHMVAQCNADLLAARRPYLLIGVGRWGSADPLLGIPVTWDQIAGARAIVEAGFADFRVTPS